MQSKVYERGTSGLYKPEDQATPSSHSTVQSYLQHYSIPPASLLQHHTMDASLYSTYHPTMNHPPSMPFHLLSQPPGMSCSYGLIYPHQVLEPVMPLQAFLSSGTTKSSSSVLSDNVSRTDSGHGRSNSFGVGTTISQDTLDSAYSTRVLQFPGTKGSTPSAICHHPVSHETSSQIPISSSSQTTTFHRVTTPCGSHIDQNLQQQKNLVANPCHGGGVLNVKCMFLGDSGVGKSSLVVSYTDNGYPHQHQSTALDNFTVDLVVDGEPICLHIFDTGGQREMRTLRQLKFSECHVFLLCFSVVQPHTFHNVERLWLRELQGDSAVAEDARLLLIGCQCDLRNDVAQIIHLSQHGQQPVAETQAQDAAQRMGAVAYVECSALTQKNLKTLFDMCVSHGLQVLQSRAAATAISLNEVQSKHRRHPITTMGKSSWRKLFCVAP